MRDVVIFCNAVSYYGFIKPYIDSLASEGRYNFIIEKERLPERLLEYRDKDCTIWIDGFDEFAIWASQIKEPSRAKLICRFHGVDILDFDCQNCRWEAFDGFAFSNQNTEAVVFDAVDRLDSMAQCVKLPPAINVSPTDVNRRCANKNVAFVGPITGRTNAAMILEILTELVEIDREFKLYVIGDFESTSLQLHFEHSIARRQLAEHIEFHDRPANMAAWYADRTYALSACFEAGHEGELIEAMSLGVQPIVLNYFGAENTFKPEWLADSIGAAVDMACAPPASAEELRQHALEHHNVLMHRAKFVELIDACDESYEPKVSILLPTYNRAEMLKNVLSRLAQQTYRNREIVVVNDASPDNTEQVVKELQKLRPDIVYHRNEVNQGNAATMAIAASKASGEFVLVLSDDDDLADNALTEFVSLWRKKKPDVIYSDLAVTDSRGKEHSQWKYRNYYHTYELLGELVFADGNKIPETFFCKRELYDEIYTQTYSKRFLNTYYLPHLRKLKMLHLPKALYRYAVHTGGTFNNAMGLFDRSKSTQNYINAAMFMYSPVRIMNMKNTGGTYQEMIAQSYLGLAHVLIEHGKRRVAGKMYTGATYEEKDNLHWVYYYNAFHWIAMAMRYGIDGARCGELLKRVFDVIDPAEFDPRVHANLPEIYKRLPWFANKAFNNLSHFIALDIATIGAPDWLNEPRYTIYSEGKARVEVCNHICKTPEEFAEIMNRTPITVVNICDAGALEPTIRHLAENQLSSVFVFNFSRIKVPEIDIQRTVFNVGPRAFSGFEEYLDFVTEQTTTSSYEHIHIEASV